MVRGGGSKRGKGVPVSFQPYYLPAEMVRGGGSKRGKGERVRGVQPRGNGRGESAHIVLNGERRMSSIQSQSFASGSSKSSRNSTQSRSSTSVSSNGERRDDTQSQGSAYTPPSSTCLTEITQMCTDGVDGEAESSQSLVTMGGYRVKTDVAPLLGHIFAKYGDIAKDSDLHSPEARSIFLEMVCSIIQKLQMLSFKALSTAEVNRMLEIIQDLERFKVDVGWLCKKLADVSEMKKLVMSL